MREVKGTETLAFQYRMATIQRFLANPWDPEVLGWAKLGYTQHYVALGEAWRRLWLLHVRHHRIRVRRRQAADAAAARLARSEASLAAVARRRVLEAAQAQPAGAELVAEPPPPPPPPPPPAGNAPPRPLLLGTPLLHAALGLVLLWLLSHSPGL